MGLIAMSERDLQRIEILSKMVGTSTTMFMAMQRSRKIDVDVRCNLSDSSINVTHPLHAHHLNRML